jgi:hypothetical protein
MRGSAHRNIRENQKWLQANFCRCHALCIYICYILTSIRTRMHQQMSNLHCKKYQGSKVFDTIKKTISRFCYRYQKKKNICAKFLTCFDQPLLEHICIRRRLLTAKFVYLFTCRSGLHFQGQLMTLKHNFSIFI